MTRRTDDDAVPRITTAAPARRDEQAARVRNYLIQMAIRIVCIVAAVLVFLVWHISWLGWILVAAAAILPNTAVMVANATARRRIEQVDGVTMPEPTLRREIGR